MASVMLDNVTLSYNRHPAVHHISGMFAAGSLTAIAGPNGAGKSTLLKAIAGMITPDEGRIAIDGIKREHIAYLPQASQMQRDFPMTVLQMITTGFWHASGGMGTITQEMKQQASQALSTVGLHGFDTRELPNLSAGQFQRALFARMLVQDAPLMLLDEPFTAIDESTTRHLLDIVLGWHAKGHTVICVLHDFEQIRKYFPRCLLIARECIAWDESLKALHPENLMGARFFRDGWADNAVCERAV
jgi:zinc/manganese transport system ATP-binding protein